MRVVKCIFGTLAGLYSVAQVFNLYMILTHSTGDVYQTSRSGGALAGLTIGAAIAISLFKSAFQKKESNKANDGSAE